MGLTKTIRHTTKPWAKAVQFKNAIPRHALTFWTVNLNRLPVRERLVNWRMAYNATVEAKSLVVLK